MKRVIYLLMLGFVCCLPACQDVEVGYLETENAIYPIDSLSLYNIEVRLAEYKEYEIEYNELAGPINEKIDEINNEILDKQDVMWGIDDEIWDLDEAIKQATGSEKERLEAELKNLENERESVHSEIRGLENKRWNCQQELKQIAIKMGFDSAAQITDGVLKLENTLKYEIPWVTSELVGVKGTEPMSYSIVGVRNEKPENAELFEKSLTIMGGGRMHVALDLKAPAGRYVVSIAIENEGQYALLKDVFTFIVEE